MSEKALNTAHINHRRAASDADTIRLLQEVAYGRGDIRPSAVHVELLLRERAMTRALVAAFAAFVYDYSNDPHIVRTAKKVYGWFEDTTP